MRIKSLITSWQARFLAGLLMVAGAALLMTACGGGGGGGEGTSGSSGSGEESSAAGTTSQGSGGSEQSIGAVLKTFANPYWTAMREGLEAEAEERGVGIEVQATRSETSIDRQVQQLEAMTGQYGCYAVAPITGNNLIQPLVPVSERGTPIVNIDAPFDTEAAEQAGVDLATFISSNNERAGTIAGERMSELLGGEGQVALVGGIEGDATSQARLGGFRQAVEGSSIEVVQKENADWSREQALTAATNIMRATPDLGGFFAANDTMALGIVQAVQNEGKAGEIEVIGVDGNEAALESIQQGNLSATVSQYPYAIGSMGVEACLLAMNGEDVPENVDAPIKLVTQENAQEALESFPRPFFDYEDPFAEALDG